MPGRLGMRIALRLHDKVAPAVTGPPQADKGFSGRFCFSVSSVCILAERPWQLHGAGNHSIAMCGRATCAMAGSYRCLSSRVLHRFLLCRTSIVCWLSVFWLFAKALQQRIVHTIVAMTWPCSSACCGCCLRFCLIWVIGSHTLLCCTADRSLQHGPL